MRRFALSHLARTDLAEIREYVARDKRAAARRLVSAFYERFRLSADFPELGEKRDDLRPDLRSFSVGSYVIFYLPDVHGVRIARVMHGARNITVFSNFG
ncbi:MAG TPA: type II toxin-antitoxin system RelE/ParE family toxin [Pirellulales bacterium]|nr:type II toxin-antitoxin system RelE/ParE family toxin [Pirellulales bacterium]